MSEHRRRRRQLIQQEEATPEMQQTAPEADQAEPSGQEREEAIERAADAIKTEHESAATEQQTEPEQETAPEAVRAPGPQAKKPDPEVIKAAAQKAYAHLCVWAKKALHGAKTAGLVLLSLLALLGSRIAVGADAARRALEKRAGVMQKPARDIEHESTVTAEDMHGAAARRRQREQLHREHIRWGLMTVCAAIAVVSLVMMTRVVVRSIRTNMLNDELAERRAQLIAEYEAAEPQSEEAPEPTPEFVIFTGEPSPEAQAADTGEESEAQDVVKQEMEATAAPQAEESAPAVKRPIVKNTQYHVSSGTPLPHMAELYEQNRDLIGWLEIPEVLDLPVMYKDNSYYLKRDFNKQKNESGTLFLDENHRFSELTQNLLLHGHNMKDGTMFGRLLQYHTDIKYLKNNPFINFDTLWKEEKYVIFAVLRVSLDVTDDDFFNYFSYPRFSTDEEFNAYIRRLQLRSEYSIPLDVAPSDALLTLSTCLDDDRLVIVCRRFREGETRTQLRQIVHLASWQ